MPIYFHMENVRMKNWNAAYSGCWSATYRWNERTFRTTRSVARGKLRDLSCIFLRKAVFPNVNERADLAARAALLAAGFHLHKRGEWRRQREQADNAGPNRSEKD
jgi:hypothetical protein